MKKRILSIALAVVLVLSTMTCLTLFSASADGLDFGSVAYENFENLTDAQASGYFSGSKDGTVTVGQKITQTGENNTKGLEVTLSIPYSWAWINYGTAKLEIPANAIGIRMWYTLNQDTNMRFMLKDQTAGAWTDIAFEGTKASKTLAKAGTYAKEIIFADTEYDASHSYQLAIEAAATADGNPATVLTIDNITFITSETYENFDNMTPAQAAAYFSGSKDATVNIEQSVVDGTEANDKFFKISMSIPYSWAWLNYGSAKLNIPAEAIGMRVSYKINQDTNMRFMLKDQTAGAWTDIALEGTKASKTLAKAGTYSKDIMFAKTEYDAKHDYQLAIEAAAIADGKPATEIEIYSIDFIRYGTSAAGDKTALDKQIADVKSTADGDSKLYTKTTWDVFKKAYDDACAITATATQRQMDQAAATLKSAYNSLEPATTDKSALKTALDTSKVVIDDADASKKYTESTLKAHKTAYDNAKAVYDDAAALQSSVNAQVAALNKAYGALKQLPSESEYAYPATDDFTVADFEVFESTLDMADLRYTMPYIVQIDNSGTLAQSLETKKAISGDKSMKIAWKEISKSTTWPAVRLAAPGGVFRNQVLYFDIVCQSDWNGVFVLYGNDSSGMPMEQYKYNLALKGSNDVQHIRIPFNQFKNNSTGERWTATEFNTVRNLPKGFYLKIQIDSTGGLTDNSFMILDNFMCIKETSKPEDTISYNYTTYSESQTQEPGSNPGGSSNPEQEQGGNTPVVIETEGTGYHELKKFDSAVASADLAASDLKGISGNGIYAYVKATKDQVMKVTLSAGKINLKYEVAVKASNDAQLVNVDYTDFVDAYGTFRELDFAKATLKVEFTDNATLSSVGYYDYAEIYASLNAEETPAEETPSGDTPSGETPSGETPAGNTPAGETPVSETPAGENTVNNQTDDASVSPKTGDNSNIVLAALVAVMAMGALVVSKKSLLSK